MFAIGFAILALWLLCAFGRPLIVRTPLGGFMLGVAVGLMVLSLVVLAWRWLP